MSSSLVFSVGAFSAMIAILFGGARAHLFDKRLPRERLVMIEVGMRYQIIHSLGLLFASVAIDRFNSTWATVTAACFIAGILLFSGSMYTHALFGRQSPLRLTPFAGVLMLVGWGSLAISPLL